MWLWASCSSTGSIFGRLTHSSRRSTRATLQTMRGEKCGSMRTGMWRRVFCPRDALPLAAVLPAGPVERERYMY